MTQKLTNTMFTGTLASSKLTGAFGSNDGSALTGLGGSGATISASDPTISTNPAGGVGTLWSNSTSGELYCCIVATAGQNVWINVGHGTGDVQPWALQGTIKGWAMQGAAHINASSIETTQTYSYTSDGNSTSHANLASGRSNSSFGTGIASPTHGYCMGGNNDTVNATQKQTDKFSLTSTTTAVDIGDLIEAGDRACSQTSETKGFISGGSSGGNVGRIESLTYASDSFAGRTNDLITARHALVGQSSETHGYASCGHSGAYSNQIEKFSLSTDSASTDVGDATVAQHSACSASSTTHGYIAGGYIGGGAPGNQNVINRFAFASDGNATDWGDMTQGKRHLAGSSSTTHGYVAGGLSGSTVNVIEKWAYASNAGGIDVGDLLSTNEQMAGNVQH